MSIYCPDKTNKIQGFRLPVIADRTARNFGAMAGLRFEVPALGEWCASKLIVASYSQVLVQSAGFRQ